MSETTEPATIKDLVERFRKFSFRLETYPIRRGGNFVYQFDAAEIAPQQVIEPFNFAEKVPFRLERDKLSLFPEFYSLFKRSFSNQAHVNEAYCRLSPEESLLNLERKDNASHARKGKNTRNGCNNKPSPRKPRRRVPIPRVNWTKETFLEKAQVLYSG
ncbi:hypothetical protein HF325_005425 [Metschnikowia pulcherrima]|uniref:Uncharacterized protein n=1 Tax=Metschnikowia pulcherrima TaxID=27326 RepID=A0A8H7GPX1_9ASCO|nr:hypothetical protein HF325_005425 [Metschnikowia pulcherrima]